MGSRRPWMVMLVLLALCYAFATTGAYASDGGELAIGEDMEDLESGGLSVLRVIFILTAILLVIVGLMIHHAGIFVTLSLICVGFAFAGKAIPALADRGGLSEGATLSREAPASVYSHHLEHWLDE